MLNEAAEQPGWGAAMPAFLFLKKLGVIPRDVMTAQFSKVKLGLDPEAIPAGYLASVAYEWDTWGPAHPADFVDMLMAELSPQRREFISTLLTTLGRSTNDS